nr:hypothetical protein BaRGS_035047 [Batillaria attramentaria]
MGKSLSGRAVIICAVVTGILAFVIGILIGRFAVCDESDGGTQAGPYDRITQDADPDVSDLLMERILAENIADNLRHLSAKPHIAGEQADFDLVTYLKDTLTGYGLDSVRVAPYHVLLSYPDGSDPNRAELLNGSNYDGELVYVNYGRVEDYDYLEHNVNVNVTGKIVIARYGKIFRGSKVDIAARHGAKGIIIYSDPADYTDPDDDRVFPDTVWLPGTAAQRGSIYNGDGDPLTPGYPATSQSCAVITRIDKQQTLWSGTASSPKEPRLPKNARKLK